ncbi:MAG TPA: ABC transporter permease [Gemmatimonadaceae bacterium]|nr:ABC transporter permease [Gemmatimonadaceae bacterium]
MILLLRRVGTALALLLLVCTLTFVLVHSAPGDAALLLLPPEADAATLARLRVELGLDAPLVQQYVIWLQNIARGDLGTSLATARPVAESIRDALPVSIGLGVASLLLTVLTGVTVGSAQARHAGSPTDTALTIVSTTLYSAPTFWLSLACVAAVTVGAAAFGVPPAWRLPAFALRDPGVLDAGAAPLDILRHAVLPVMVLALTGAAGTARFARSAIVEAARGDVRRTALAKGVSAPDAWSRHVVRVALPSVAALVALSVPGIVAGSVFVEGVFAWPGMGKLLLGAVAQRDHPVILAVTLLYAAVVIGTNLLTDLLLPLLDPRRTRT